MKQFGTYQEIARKPYIVITIGIIGGLAYVAETIALPERPLATQYINYACFIITFITIGLFATRKLDHWQTFSIYALSLGGNLLLAPFFDLPGDTFGQFYMRNLFYFAFFIPLTGMIWGNRIMILSIGIIFIQFIAVNVINENSFMLRSMPSVGSVLIIYGVVMYSLIESIQKFLIEKDQLITKLDTSNTTKLKLLSIISHDLRTPIMAMANLAYFIEDEIKDSKNDTLREYAELMGQTSESTTRLINNLIEWSRSQTDEFLMEKMKLTIQDECRKVTTLYDSRIKTKKIAVEFGPFNSTEVYADPDALEVVLRNIISNAIKFTGEYGQIFISSYAEGDFDVIVIKDSGIGMDENTKAKLYDETIFQSTTGTDSEKGSGIGFNVCVELMRLQGGEIKVESELGFGTLVTLHFPKEGKLIKPQSAQSEEDHQNSDP